MPYIGLCPTLALDFIRIGWVVQAWNPAAEGLGEYALSLVNLINV